MASEIPVGIWIFLVILMALLWGAKKKKAVLQIHVMRIELDLWLICLALAGIELALWQIYHWA